MRTTLVIAALLCAGCYHWTPNRPSLDVLGPGPATNLRSDQAWTNASAHLAWSIAIPATGYSLGDRKGLRVACWAWIAQSVGQEVFFHGQTPADEVRTDLLSRLLVPVTLLVVDAIVR